MLTPTEMPVNFSLAVNNLPGVMLKPQEAINVYDILLKESVIITPQVLDYLETRLSQFVSDPAEDCQIFWKAPDAQVGCGSFTHSLAPFFLPVSLTALRCFSAFCFTALRCFSACSLLARLSQNLSVPLCLFLSSHCATSGTGAPAGRRAQPQGHPRHHLKELDLPSLHALPLPLCACILDRGMFVFPFKRMCELCLHVFEHVSHAQSDPFMTSATHCTPLNPIPERNEGGVRFHTLNHLELAANLLWNAAALLMTSLLRAGSRFPPMAMSLSRSHPCRSTLPSFAFFANCRGHEG